MPKWEKQKYEIDLHGTKSEVEGVVCGQWGIDKRDSFYYLTYIPNGYLAESARTMKFLKDLVATPEFENFRTDTKPLLETIKRFRDTYGWNK